MTTDTAAWPVIEVASGVWLAAGGVGEVPVSAHPGDRARAAGLPAWRAREFLAGRGLLRALLGRVRASAAGACVGAAPRGAPRLVGHDGLGVSVAHDGGTVAAAVAAGRAVGVDVQHPDDRPSRALARRLLGGRLAEFDALDPADAARELAWVWTAQESCVKATGEGLAGRPWTVEVPLGARSGLWRGHRWLSLRDRFTTPLSCAFTVRTGQPTGPCPPEG
ncbi:4'-phosphopantetheinyl transferase family protein [Streptomyces chattanoogensis]|uniref:4'-phosphopantetheinyl transferase family protein n=1 Tax=Streptomyces chattanoogensis TaxID=66876 RepID=UPI0036C99283